MSRLRKQMRERETKRLHNLIMRVGSLHHGASYWNYNFNPGDDKKWVEKKILEKKNFQEAKGYEKDRRNASRLSAIAYRKNCLYAVARFRKQPILRPISWNDPKHMARCSVGKKERPATGGESHTHTRGKSINFDRVSRNACTQKRAIFIPWKKRPRVETRFLLLRDRGKEKFLAVRGEGKI